MPKGLCVVCHKTVGTGFFDETGYVCPTCQMVYCGKCPPKSAPGFLSPGVPCCPECGKQLMIYK